MLEEMGVLYRGAILGLVIAAPVGPVGLLCIRRTLQKGLIIGYATGFGAAIADAIFGAIAVMGIGVITDFIHHYEATIRIIGGLIVLATAWHTWHDRPKPPHSFEIVEKVLAMADTRVVWETLRAMISGFAITIANPLTLFGTLAVVATFGDVSAKLDTVLMIGGIFTGSAVWWAVLSGGISLLRGHCNEDRILTINRITAVALAILALWAVASGIHSYLPR